MLKIIMILWKSLKHVPIVTHNNNMMELVISYEFVKDAHTGQTLQNY